MLKIIGLTSQLYFSSGCGGHRQGGGGKKATPSGKIWLDNETRQWYGSGFLIGITKDLS